MPERDTLLVVEDEGAIRQAVSELLTDEGYSVVAVGDLRSALLVLKRHRVSAVVLDWRLADDTAEPILDMLARTQTTTVVVLVSAALEAKTTADRFGVPFAKKPLDLDLLPDIIECAIRDRRVPRTSQRSE